MLFAGGQNHYSQQGGRVRASSATLRRFQQASWALLVIIAVVSVSGLALGVYTYIYIKNLHAGAFYPFILFLVSDAVCTVGIVKKSREKLLISGGIFLLGISCLVAGVGALIDGFHGYHTLKTDFTNCSHNSILSFYVDCDVNCQLLVQPDTCYCCDIHVTRGCTDYTFSISEAPSSYEGVTSCDDVSSMYQILCWASVGVNLLCILLAVVAMGILNRFKKLSSYGSSRSVRPAARSAANPDDYHRGSHVHYLGGPTVVTGSRDMTSPHSPMDNPPPYS